MSTPPEPDTFDLGPGSLKIGATGTETDVSCLVNNAVLSAEKTEGDSTTKLCGTVKAGSVTYQYHFAGNVDTDIADDAGLFAMSQDQKGTEQSFIFIPSTDGASSATGKLVIDPLDFGGDEMGAPMTSDFDFTVVGDPTFVYGDGLPLADAARTNGNGKAKEPANA